MCIDIMWEDIMMISALLLKKDEDEVGVAIKNITKHIIHIFKYIHTTC